MKYLLLICLSLLTSAALSANAADAKETYDKTCAKCHGADGKGDTKMGKKLGVKDLSDAKVQADLKDEVAIRNIKEGVKEGEKTLMKPAEGLSDDEIKGLVTYIRTFKK
jgi:mono/diheme cytochrome c family protein